MIRLLRTAALRISGERRYHHSSGQLSKKKKTMYNTTIRVHVGTVVQWNRKTVTDCYSRDGYTRIYLVTIMIYIYIFLINAVDMRKPKHKHGYVLCTRTFSWFVFPIKFLRNKFDFSDTPVMDDHLFLACHLRRKYDG